MTKAFDEYTFLAGSHGARGSLWQGPDHLLVVDGQGWLLSFGEVYRRVDYANIQSLTLVRTQTYFWMALAWGAAALVFFLFTMVALSEEIYALVTLGTLTAALLASEEEGLTSITSRKRVVSSVVKEVAASLGNTPAVCRASYVDPRVVDRFLNGDTIALPRGRDLTDETAMRTYRLVFASLLVAAALRPAPGGHRTTTKTPTSETPIARRASTAGV